MPRAVNRNERAHRIARERRNRATGDVALVQRTRENASDGDGALLIRTDFDQQQVWDDLCELIRKYPAEGLLTDLLLIDDSCYEGATAEQLLNLVPDDAGYPYIAIADAVTAELADRKSVV